MKSNAKFGMGVFLLSLCMVLHNSAVIEDASIINEINCAFDSSVDLKNHLSHVKVEEEKDIHPNEIIVILGEAFSKYHSSLYGYEKQTNPLLDNVSKRGELYAFCNVESPSTTTASSFKYILNTNTREKRGKWYDNPSIIELFGSVGYNSIWISNQQQKGFYNSIAGCFGALCNYSYFPTSGVDQFDEVVLDKYISFSSLWGGEKNK